MDILAECAHEVDHISPGELFSAADLLSFLRRSFFKAFEALNHFVRKHGGAILSPQGRFVRIECPKDSLLPAKLRELGYIIAEHGTVTRVTGAPSVSARTERLTHAVPSAFAEMDVIEVTLSGK